jgi:nicotinamide-nucleotide amidase
MREIVETLVLPELSRRTQGRILRRRVLRIAGMGESAVEELVSPIYEKWSTVPVTILAAPGEIQLHLCAAGGVDEVESVLDAMEADFRRVLGNRIFGRDQEDLATAVGRLLRARRQTVATAESCTGGMIAALLTDVPGSSDYFLGGVVAYANSVKRDWLFVSEETLRDRGAVSDAAAREMAQGARNRFAADLAVAVTGIAGPDGGTPEKPVGTVFLAVADRDGRVAAKRRSFVGDREMVRRSASSFALELVRRHLEEEKTAPSR